jgi:hypothetical protein
MTLCKYVLIGCVFALPQSSAAYAQNLPTAERVIEFPDLPGYVTLKCDFHMHTVFSDGSVWPDIRVEEAVRDGLDAISLTEHLEYLPHEDDIPYPDRNRAHDVARESVGERDLIVLRGSEITRDMPPGHANAIFLEDANKLLLEDPIEVFREARRQGGFTFWNHPHWTSQRADGIARLDEMHLELIREGLLQGIEVVNELTYSDEALQIALDHDLTIIGNSDIHGLVDWLFEVPRGGHRPVTLVFATERSAAGIKQALEAGRTAVWFRNMLIGKEEYLRPLVTASLEVIDAVYRGDTSVLTLTIENTSDAEYVLDNRSGFRLHAASDVITLGPHSETVLQVKTLERRSSVSLAFEVLNAVTAPGVHPEVVLEVTVGH